MDDGSLSTKEKPEGDRAIRGIGTALESKPRAQQFPRPLIRSLIPGIGD